MPPRRLTSFVRSTVRMDDIEDPSLFLREWTEVRRRAGCGSRLPRPLSRLVENSDSNFNDNDDHDDADGDNEESGTPRPAGLPRATFRISRSTPRAHSSTSASLSASASSSRRTSWCWKLLTTCIGPASSFAPGTPGPAPSENAWDMRRASPLDR